APMSERNGRLCTPVAVQPAGDGFALVMSPRASATGALEILVVDARGITSSAGFFPDGTSTASFAADLVG
ncbi:MAG TPA: hypothetical protein VFX15_08430, partial [Actinomycetes bacterium]|nr:hypothetical protein [Actinomycetes bacterium]